MRRRSAASSRSPARWRTFDVTTRVEIKDAADRTPASGCRCRRSTAPYQQSLDSSWSGNASAARIVADSKYGAQMLLRRIRRASTARRRRADEPRADARSRHRLGTAPAAPAEDAATLKRWTAADRADADRRHRPRHGARGDARRAQVRRDPGARASTTGSSRTPIASPRCAAAASATSRRCSRRRTSAASAATSTVSSSACAARPACPARDVYGIRIAPSAFGYRELGGNPAKLQGAQHCRAEVWLKRYGWVAMDPADVGKVMRQETPEWIKDDSNPVVAPVKQGAVRRLGRQLDGLQQRARRRAARLARAASSAS